MKLRDILDILKALIEPPKIRRHGDGFSLYYGRVNRWMVDLPKLKKEIRECGKAKIGYHIELLGWSRYSGGSDAMKAEIETAYKALLDYCTLYGVPVFVSIANDNAGQGKYGDKSPRLEKQRALLDWALQLVLKHGHKVVVLVQPVAEIQSSFGATWDAQANALLIDAGFATCYNGSAGRPSGASNHTTRAWHPQKTSDKVPSGAFCVSDCGSIILQLNEGYDGKGKPDTIRAYVRRCREMGCTGYAHYAFLYNGDVDAAAIRAVAGR